MTEQPVMITSVPGIRVGHAQRRGNGWLSGVTVVLPPPGTVASVDVRGGGPGTHETDALDPTTLVKTVDAVVLTGGSAYGLTSAGGVQQWCEENGRGFAVAGGVVPIVPAAAIFDLGRGGDFAARPGAELGYAAVAQAAAQPTGHDVERGNVGAGTGAVIGAGAFKGGVGSAALTGDGGLVVGAIAVVNALGLPYDSSKPPAGLATGVVESVLNTEPTLNTTLAVVAVNARLDAAECKRTASAAHAGLARALSPSHTLADGDTIFALATGEIELDRSSELMRQRSLIALQSLAAEAVRLAIADGVAQAASVTTPAGTWPRYPSAI